MPNTLAHIGIQGLVNASLPRTKVDYLRWSLLAYVIPDVPWISRYLLSLTLDDLYRLEFYLIVQASLLFSLLFCFMVALFAKRVLVVLSVLSTNCVLHLFLDACEIKPGNGVHFFAPSSWEMISFALVWPEHWIIMLATALGLAVAFFVLIAPKGMQPLDDLSFSRNRVIAAIIILFVYIAAPLGFTDGPYEADNRSLRTLLNVDQRFGRPVAIDRNRTADREGQTVLITNFGEELVLIGQDVPAGAIVSLRGYFVGRQTVHVTEIHRNAGRLRDFASVIGLALIALIWVNKLMRARGPKRTGVLSC